MATLNVKDRTATGHRTKAMRKEGQVPMALITKPDHTIRLIQADAHAVRQAVGRAHGAGMFDIQIDGEAKPRSVIVKQIDKEYLSQRINTVTLMEVSKTDTITADIPVTHIGTPEAVSSGVALLATPTTHVKVKGQVSKIPDSFEVDVTELAVGGHITAADLKLPDGVELASPADTLLFSVSIAKEPELEVETAPEGEPELVGAEAESGEASE